MFRFQLFTLFFDYRPHSSQALGTALKLSKIAPATGSRIKDVVFSMGIAKIPFLAALVSPKFWGNVLTKPATSKEVVKQSNRFKELLKEPLTQIILQRMLIGGLKDEDL